MCGIIGYLGINSTNLVISKLKSLDYRGYDSWGIVYLSDKYHLIKKIGEIKPIKNKIARQFIAHTRWATNGVVSIRNAHPHESNHFYVVHNGIIKNYHELYDKYLKGVKLKSDTDTYIINLLLDYFYDGDTLKAMNKISSLIDGDYSILIINKDESNKIYYMKKGMPLYYQESLLSSDIASFNNGNYYKLNDGIGFIDSFINSSSGYMEIINSNEYIYTNKKPYMLSEIYEQKDALERIYKEDIKLEETFSNIYLVGCGSSYNACLMGELFFRQRDIDARAIIASERDNLICNDNTLFIYVTQSGETKDVIDCAREYIKYNSIALTENMSSTITKYSNPIRIFSGYEKAVGATKTYLASVVILYLLSGGDKRDIKDLLDNISSVIDNKQIYKMALRLRKTRNLIIVGKKEYLNAAHEGALKLREIAYINAFSFPSGELKHGSIALINHKSIVLALSGKKDDLTNIIVDEVKSRGAQAYKIDEFINCDIKLKYLLQVVFFQMLAYYIGTLNKYNIDKPKNLAKSVTVE